MRLALNNLGVTEQVLELEGLDQVGVPDQALVSDLDVFVGLVDFINFVASLLEGLLNSVHCCVPLHVLLHVFSDFCCRDGALASPQCLNPGNRGLSGVLRQLGLALSWLVLLLSNQSRSPTENNQVQQGVGPESVSSMH